MLRSLPVIPIILALSALSPGRLWADGRTDGRDCRVLAEAESAAPRVRCEDDGEEFRFSAQPARKAASPSWLCTTVQARLADDPARTTEAGTLQTLSIETLEQRDRRTQEEDLLRASRGQVPLCWDSKAIVRDNPRARARAEAEEKAREEREKRAEEERRQREAVKKERERVERILAPHRRPPQNSAEVLIQRTTPAGPRSSDAPERLEICLALDQSLSMAGTYGDLALRFGRISEAWRYHYPAGVVVTAIGFGQESKADSYRGQLLLERSTPTRLGKLLASPALASGGTIEPALDAVADCEARFRPPAAPGTRREIVLASDESGDLLPGSPDGLALQRRLRKASIGLELIDPRAEGCPDTLSNSSDESELARRFQRVIGDDEAFIECSTAALRYSLWQGPSGKWMHDDLEERLFRHDSLLQWNSGEDAPLDGDEGPFEDLFGPTSGVWIAP